MQIHILIANELAALLIPLLAVSASFMFRAHKTKLKVLLFAQLAAAVCAAMGFVLFPFVQNTLIVNPVPGIFAERLDFLSVCLLSAISFIAAVVIVFSERYLLGDETRLPFIRLLVLLSSAAGFLSVADNLIFCLVCWHAISILLWKIIGLRKESAGSARLVLYHHLLSDVLFLSAVALLVNQCGTSDLSLLAVSPAVKDGCVNLFGMTVPVSLANAASLLIVLSLSIKSALFPFHRWLLSTLNAPTPLSGLLHAGVVNVSAVVAARLFPLLSEAPLAMAIWGVIALGSAVIGTLSMSAQFDVKRKLVYSTVGQMGFMCLQCAVGAIPAAIFHLVAHGLFKSHMFLQSGNSVAEGMVKRKWGTASDHSGSVASESGRAPLLLVSLSLPLGVWMFCHDSATGLSVSLALMASVAMLSHLPSFKRIGFVLSVLAGVILISFFAISYISAEAMESLIHTGGASAPALLSVGLLLLVLANLVVRAAGGTAFGKAIYVHALNGFYVEEITGAIRRQFSGTNVKIKMEAK